MMQLKDYIFYRMYIAYRDKEGDEKGIAGAVTPDLIRGRNDSARFQ
jgi:hypothetical protein